LDIVIRPVKERFLQEVAFPIFEMGMVNARVALERLVKVLADDRTRTLVEMLLERGVDGGFWELDAEPWLETVYRLVFRDWEKVPDGWISPGEDVVGYAGTWEQVLHLSLMLEDPRYPYWDEGEARAAREAWLQEPVESLGLASLVTGVWEPLPRFAAHEVLPSHGDRGRFKSGEVAIADWSFRPANLVSFWARQLPTKLGRLLRREEQRLKPLEMMESQDILDYWNGKLPEPPFLSVAFSGLGLLSLEWVRELGRLTRQIREAAQGGRGLTIIITQPPQQRVDRDELY